MPVLTSHPLYLLCVLIPTAFLPVQVQGELPYGRWVSHLQSWLSATSDYSSSELLLLRYEEMVADLPSTLQKVARFVGMSTLSDDQLCALLPKLSFAGMRSDQARYSPVSVQWKEGFSFIRKGIVGDSRDAWAGLDEGVRTHFEADVEMAAAAMSPEHASLLRSLVA